MAPDPRPEVFAAIAHPVRRRILDLLVEEDRPVNAIASNFDVSRPAISQHLRVLLDAGLVAEQRHGRERRYRLVPEELAEIYGWLSHYERFWTHRLQSLAERLADDQDTSSRAADDEPSSSQAPAEPMRSAGAEERTS
jgi:DNA-binding transcriptional ArsR family regulator